MNDLPHLSPEVRLEMLVGTTWDVMIEAKKLTDELKLRANASAVTRGQLDLLREYVGGIFSQLQIIRDELKDVSCRRN